jgi:ribosome biogenesis SPOUT family RNA methylase Rps3
MADPSISDAASQGQIQSVVDSPVTPAKFFIVEHLDPFLEKWSSLEYAAIASECATTSPSGSAVFVLTGVPETLVVPSPLANAPGLRIEHKNIEELCVEGDEEPVAGLWKKQRVCLMDPRAEQDLQPQDADEFDVFLFGGILGLISAFFTEYHIDMSR